MAEMKNVGDHVHDLADGRMLAPGEMADLDGDAMKDPHNEDLVSIGVLISTDTADESTKKTSAKSGKGE